VDVWRHDCPDVKEFNEEVVEVEVMKEEDVVK